MAAVRKPGQPVVIGEIFVAPLAFLHRLALHGEIFRHSDGVRGLRLDQLLHIVDLLDLQLELLLVRAELLFGRDPLADLQQQHAIDAG